MGTTAGFAAGSLMTFGVFLGVIVFTEPPPNTNGAANVITDRGKGPRLVIVSSDRYGMLQLNARVNDEITVRFLVDTGATFTSLGYRDANRLTTKLAPGPLVELVTANGNIRVPTTRFTKVQVGHIVVTDLKGVMESDESVNTNILGMSFLSGLKRWEYQNGKLLLEQ